MRLTWGTLPLTLFDYFSVALVVMCILGALLRPAFFTAIFDTIERGLARLADHRWVCALIVFTFPIALRLLILSADPPPSPAIHDEYAYLLQADTFASGRLTNPQPPSPSQLESIYILATPTYESEYQVAQASFLGFGQRFLSSPWAGVLLSVGVFCAITYWALMGWVPSVWAFIGALLIGIEIGVLSYWTNSYWGGFVPGIGGALALGGLARLVTAARATDALLSALGLMILLNSRPVEGALLFIVAAAFLAFRLLTNRLGWRVFSLRIVGPALLVFLPALAWMGFYDARVTGKATEVPYFLYRARYSIPQGFYWQPLKYANRPMPADIEVEYKAQTKQHQHGGSIGGLVRATVGKVRRFWDFYVGVVLTIALVGLPFIWRQHNMSIVAASLFAVLVLDNLTFFAYFPHYSAAVATVIFLVIIQCLRVLRGWGPRGLFLSRALPLACCVSLGIATAGRLAESHLPSSAKVIAKLWDSQYEPVLRGSRDAFESRLQHTPGKHLVLIHYNAAHHNNDNSWTFNSANLASAKIVWARQSDDAAANLQLIRAFKDRRVWLAEPDETPKRVLPYPGLHE
jgi:hypothetical protein